MIPENSKGIIELDDVNVKCIIFQIDHNNNSEILSTSITESKGIHNGVIIKRCKSI